MDNLAEQRRRNRLSRDNWDLYGPHRGHVTKQILSAAAPHKGELVVLGAGNANDLDLQALVAHFTQVILVDVDDEALAYGADQQDLSQNGRLATLSVDFATASASDLDGPFATVASVGVLTQLIESHAERAGSTDPQETQQQALAVRDQHLKLMLQLTAPGGGGVLVTDFVSSVTCPTLPNLSDATLASAAAQWLRQRNFFTGTNPFAIGHRFIELAGISPAEINISEPWRWDQPTKSFAVAAVAYRRGLQDP